MIKKSSVLVKEKTKTSSATKILITTYVIVGLVIFTVIMAFYFASNLALINVTLPSDKNSFSATQFTAASSTLDIPKETKIYRFSVVADVALNNNDALVRLILVDKNNKEYLVYEGNSAINSQSNFTISDSDCEETCSLPSVVPTYLKIQIKNASIKIKSVNYSDSVGKTRLLVAPSAKNIADKKINSINAKHPGWIAGHTSVSNLSYSDKKKLFTTPDGQPVADLPDLQGFEYYKGGIFTVKSDKSVTKSVSVASNIIVPDSFDWRNVNGENWVTPVKDQGGVGTCWAFSRVGVLEAQINLYFNKQLNVDLSEQTLADCESGLGPIPELSRLNSECIPAAEVACGDNIIPNRVCSNKNTLFVDEQCNPYVQRYSHSRENPSGNCTLDNICSDWKMRNWQISDYLNGYFLECPSSSSLNPDFNEVALKKFLITRGPLDMALGTWGHAMALVGYKKDNSVYDPNWPDMPIGGTDWVFKNSWGADWGDHGYAVMFGVSLDDLYFLSQPIGVFTPPINHSYWPAGFDGRVSCTDKDKDGYCFWGVQYSNWSISDQPPAGTLCPGTCKKDSAKKYIKDCDDSTNKFGPFISENNLNCKPMTICSDSDGPKNFYVKGQTYGDDGRGAKWLIDSCIAPSSVYDYACMTSINPSYSPYDVWTDIYKCPHGCKNGACICVSNSECPTGYACSNGACVK
jgi:C1A family cysteine protease